MGKKGSRGAMECCDCCGNLAYKRHISEIPIGHYLIQTTDWQRLCTRCAIEFNVPLVEGVREKRKRTGRELPPVDMLPSSEGSI